MFLSILKQKSTLFLLCLTVVLLGLHLHIIDNPSQMILDEQHYVPEANSIIDEGKLLHPEHPSLSKLIIAAGITLFGDNDVGWRIFPILFGIISVILFYFICTSLTKRKDVPIIATFIFGFENMTFIQGSVAMLDVFGLTFMLASFLAFLRSRHIEGGILLALAATAKIPMAFGGVTLVLFWLIGKRFLNKPRQTPFEPVILGIIKSPVYPAFDLLRTKPYQARLGQRVSKPYPIRHLLKFLIAAPLAFALLMPFFDWIATDELLYPWDRVDYMLDTHSTLTFTSTTHGSATHPWEWITLPSADMAYWYHPTYNSAVSWNLWALIIPAMLYALYGAIRKQPLLLFALLWIAATYLSWIPADLIKDRVMFIFYFYPTVGAICLIVAFGISKMLACAARRRSRKARWAIRIPVIAWIISHMVLFVMMGPLLL